MHKAEIIWLLKCHTLAFIRETRLWGGDTSSLRGKKTMSSFVMNVTHCHIHDDPGTLSTNLTALHRHSQCPRVPSTRPRLIFNMKSYLILPNSLECNHLKACHQSRTPSLLLPPLELQAIRNPFRQEVWNAQQNLIKQTGLWQRTQGKHPTSINNAMESLMTRQGTHNEILKQGIPAGRPRAQVQAELSTWCFFKAEEKRFCQLNQCP